MGDKPEYQRHPERHKFFAAGIGVAEGEKDTGGEHSFFAKMYAIPDKYKIVTLESLMQQMKTEHVDIVRMDCEGAEWPVLESWM